VTTKPANTSAPFKNAPQRDQQVAASEAATNELRVALEKQMAGPKFTAFVGVNKPLR